MKKLAMYSFALSLGLASVPAFAGEKSAGQNPIDKKQPFEMTEQQLDNATAGALVNVIAFDVVDVQNNRILNNVTVPVQAQVGILSAQGASQGTITNVRPVP